MQTVRDLDAVPQDLRMRLRSEWITLFTVTSLAVCALALPKRSDPSAADAKRKEVAAAGIDFMPVGTPRAAVKGRIARRQLP